MLLVLVFVLGFVVGAVVYKGGEPPVDPAPYRHCVGQVYGQRSPDTTIPVHPVSERPAPPKVVR